MHNKVPGTVQNISCELFPEQNQGVNLPGTFG
jgi:hypothetical protein